MAMKIVIVILIVMGVVFAVGAGAAFRQPEPKAPSDPAKAGKSHHPSCLEKFLGGLSLSSGQSNPLKKSVYHAGDPEEAIGKADKIRQVKLRITHRDGCVIPIEYDDNAPHDKKMSEQHTDLPWVDDEGHSKDETTLVLMKSGGTLRFRTCRASHKGACPARIDVVN